ncbi:hypothetical protein BH24ACT4_BH24ACT4_21180 [soil metagenome]
MRTTLTLDDDVAARLAELRRADPDRSHRDLVNAALRTGLDHLARSEPTEFRTTGVEVGRCLVPSLDDTSAVLEWLDEADAE